MTRIDVSGKSKVAVARRVKEIVQDIYPNDQVEYDRDSGRHKISVPPGKELVEIFDARDGTVIDLDMASSTVKSRVTSVYGDNETVTENVTKRRDTRKDNRTGDSTESGTGPVVKPYSHEEVNYMERGDSGFEEGHSRCADCAHYDGDGHCRVVPNIDPQGYCESLYADVGVFAHEHGNNAEVNLVIWGEEYSWNPETIDDFIDKIKSRLESK